MIKAETFMREARARGFCAFTGVPCSYLQPFINHVIDAPDLDYIGAANEGDAVAIASGAELAGKRAMVMFQNSGLGNAVNPLTSLNMIFRIPVLLIVTWRGEPGGAHDEPQHDLMGEITPRMLETMRVPWEVFPSADAEIGPALERAVVHMTEHRTPYAFVMKKGSVAPHALSSSSAGSAGQRPRAEALAGAARWATSRPSRREVLEVVQRSARPTDAIIATTGYIGRTLYALEDRPSQMYLVGSMGCASSVGLGLATYQPRRRVVVVDGDGAALMRLGAFATLGHERPENLVHLVIDNEMHESTGGQATVSHAVDLGAVAAACGYPRVIRVAHLDELSEALRGSEAGLSFVHVKVRPGDVGDLPRPKITPVEVAARFRAWLRETQAPE